jgi:taurine dioxygenase
MQFEPLTPHIGTRITGIGACSALNDDDLALIKAETIRRHVVFIPNQNLSALELVKVAKHFGNPLASPHPKFGSVDGVDEVSLVINDADHPPDINVWHSDLSYLPKPAGFCLLQAEEIPPLGGDTLWASLTAAYDALSPTMKEFLAPLSVYHQLPFDGFSPELIKTVIDKPVVAVHPLIRRIPETDRLCLFINRVYAQHIIELSKSESDGVLAGLLAHCESPDFQVRHRWQAGDLVIWDNRAALHFAAADYYPQRRVMHRVALEGASVEDYLGN